MKKLLVASLIAALALLMAAMVVPTVGAQEHIEVSVTQVPQQGRVLTQIQLDSDVPFNTESIVVEVQGSDSFVAFTGFTNENKTLLVGISSEKSCFHVRITGSTVNGIGFVFDRWFTSACFVNHLPLVVSV